MRRFLKYSLLFFAFFSALQDVRAQRIVVTAEMGTGLAYVTGKNWRSSGYTPRITGNASASLLVPFSSKLILETGLEYAQKGFKTNMHIADADDPERSIHYTATTKRNYLNIPLVVSFRVWHAPKHQMFIGGGMNFGFLMNASTEETFDYYHRNVFTGTSSVYYSARIGLVQSYDKNGYDKIDMYLFDAGLKLQLRYVYKERYTIRLFHQLGIADPAANTLDGAGNSKLKQQYTGISVGVVFPRFKN